MNRSKLADLSEIVSSIAIVATLIYLTIEIRQNTNALQSQTHEAVLSSAQAELNTLIANPSIAASLASAGPLATESEHVQLDAWLASALRSREFAWLQFRDGAIDEAQWETEVAVLLGIFDSSMSLLWWGRLGRDAVGPDFAAFIDQILELNPPTDELWPTALSWSVPEPGQI